VLCAFLMFLWTMISAGCHWTMPMRRGHQQPGARSRSVPPVPRLGSENGFAAAVPEDGA
jgi:hypothetical protein